MLPNTITSWEEFKTHKAPTPPEAVEGALAESIRQVKARKRPPAKEQSVADLLLQAVELASARRGRISRADSIREQTLLDVLQHSIRRAK